MPTTADFEFDNHGSIILVRPMNADATAFLHSAVDAEPWQYMGDALAIEPRYARDLADGLQEEGFTVA